MADFKYYEKGGKKYERYSTVAEFFPHPNLVKWKVRLGARQAGQSSRKALKIGARVDELCEKDILEHGYKLRKSDCQEVLNCMQAWERWKQDFPERFKEINMTQATVYYDDWGVAGTPDLVAKERITDIKTSRRVSLIYWVQLAFYNRFYECPEKWVLRLDKGSGFYEYLPCPEEYSQEYLEQIFVGMLNVFNFFKSEKEEL